ncbi:hypothetical protein F183_A20800 [Bryobacterales bacterium F-183]|nr:hypothetical protein F183_A20800 [Bryobacterales bacterium F-183]
MAVLLPSLPASSAEEVLPHKTWTREELLLIETTGVFEGTHYELIDGELIDKMGKKRPHSIAGRATVYALEEAFGRNYVEQESSIDVAPQDNPRNEPEPDVVVLRQLSGEIRSNPAPSDIALVVEVSDTTLRQDLTTKARLYARAGIADYWVLDIQHRLLHVLRQPAGDMYLQHLQLRDDESVSPLERPDSLIRVSSLLG